MSRARNWLASLGLASLALSAPAAAQAPHEQPRRLPAFGRSTATTDDTTSLVLNPANLAFMPGAELRWTGLFLDDTNRVPWQGHAFAFAFPIPFIPLATGVRLDFVDPPNAMASTPQGAANYQWLTWGLALGSDAAAFGLSVQRTYSDKALADSLGSFSLGYSTRPFNGVALSLVANDINAPVNAAGGRIDRTFDMALGIRPLGTRSIELGLEAEYTDREDDAWTPRGTLGIDIPSLGRLRGDFTMYRPADPDERSWTASAALAVNFNPPTGSMELAGGAITGDALGEDGSWGVQADAAFRGWRETAGIESPRYALRVRI